MEFIKLKKNLKKDFSGFKKIKLALLGDSATQLMSIAVRGYGFNFQLDIEVFEADYNQIERQITFKSSEMYQSEPEYIFIVESVQKLKKRFYKLTPSQRVFFAQNEIEKYKSYLNELSSNTQNVKVIISNFIEINDAVFGQYSNKVESSFLYQIRKLNFGLMDLARSIKFLFICDVQNMASLKGYEQSIDNRNYVDSDMTFSVDFLSDLSKGIVDIILAVSGSARKCLVLDLDNTTWGGIIGDDGIENIQIGDLDQGKAFSELQTWAKELKSRGILLAVCSKNDESVAKEPFENHPDMVLRLEDIAIFCANWDSKVDNLIRIKDFLNVGYDSIVFIDDNPYERGVVRRHLPNIIVPDMPEDPSDYLPFLVGLNLFETANYTEEDSQRTLHFHQELKRESTQASFTDEREFLKSLDMKALIEPFSNFNIPRVTQLIQRSNQFNLRTIRYTEDELQRLAVSESYISWAVSVDDQFGSYGLISAIIGKIEEDSIFIDTWVMSCRVLKRGVESFALNNIVEAAKLINKNTIRAEYIPTAKNGLVKDHYINMGFHEDVDGFWMLQVDEYKDRETYFTKL